MDGSELNWVRFWDIYNALTQNDDVLIIQPNPEINK